MNRLVGKTSPGNVPSQKILLKCGARKGEVLEKVISLYSDKGEKSDMWCYYLDRPGYGPEASEGVKVLVEEERGLERDVLC